MAEKKSREVFKKIIEDIKDNKYKKGMLFPSEDQLSNKYNVGRSTVREALKALEILEILDISPGKGTFLNKLSIDFPFHVTSLLYRPNKKIFNDILEFRRIYDIIVLKLLVKKINEDDVKELEDIIEHSNFYYKRKNILKFSEYDFKFHETLSKITRNSIAISLFNLLYTYLKYTISKTINEDRMLKTLQAHNEIFSLIKQKKYSESIKAMEKHLDTIKRYYQKYTSHES